MESRTAMHAAEDDPEPGDLVCAGVFASARAAADHGLVVLAMGLPYWLGHSSTGYEVWVEGREAAAVREEFLLYDQANANWPPVPVQPWAMARVPVPWFTPFVWVVVLFWVFRVQFTAPGLVEQGMLDGQALFFEGEWWRPLTALFLHGDLAHLVGNAVIGMFVLTQVIAAVGVVRAWWDIALASVAGNIITAVVHLGTGVRSLGASTTVFAGLGWLTGRAIREAMRSGAGVVSRATIIPLAAGLVLLGWLGSGDWRTDVIAHAAGFACGLAVAVIRRRQE